MKKMDSVLFYSPFLPLHLYYECLPKSLNTFLILWLYPGYLTSS